MLQKIKNLFRKPDPIVIYKKDPNGLLRRDMTLIKKYCGTGKYTVGDSIESVAYRQAQLDLINFIENRLLAQPTQLK